MLNIVKGIFGIDPTDMLQGLKHKNPLEGGMFPDLTPKMFGGSEAAGRIGKDFNISPELLDQAAAEWKKLDPAEWAAKYNPQGINMDVPSGKAMFEFPDNEVQLLKGKDPFDPKQFPDNKAFGINEIVKTDLLNKAYPEMEDIKVKFVTDPERAGSNGTFDPQDNILTLNRAADKVKEVGIIPTMLHEIQHYIQGREMLTQGESFRIRLQDYPDFGLAAKSMQKAIGSKALGLDVFQLAKNSDLTATDMINSLSVLAENPGVDTKAQLVKLLGDKKAKEFLDKSKNYKALEGFFADKDMAKEAVDSAFKDYINVAGEAYARSTADRRNLTMGERKELPAMQMLDVPFSGLTTSKAGAILDKRMGRQSVVNPLESSITDTTAQGL